MWSSDAMSDPHTSWCHLAQLNIATLKAPLDTPSMQGFTEQLAPINALADSAPGFVWRLTEDGADDATALRPFGDDLLINLSVWEDVDSLWEFTFRTAHLELIRRRREWIHHMKGSSLVLWWIPTGNIPSVDEAGRRLDLLRERGPSPEAFTLRSLFPPPQEPTPHI